MAKKCKGCGWVYPDIYASKRCKFCHFYLAVPAEITCKTCGKHVTEVPMYIAYNKKGNCNACDIAREIARYKAAAVAYYAANSEKIKARAKIAYNAPEKHLERQAYRISRNSIYSYWTYILTNISVHNLTEDEWIQACAFFYGKCAVCGADEIATRGMFVKPSSGGKYNKCNVIPMCSYCATHMPSNRDAFMSMDEILHDNVITRRGGTKERLYDIMSYLQSRIKEANEQQN